MWICVPDQSLFGAAWQPSLDILRSHIMKPSPYFQDELETLNGKTLSVDGNLLTTANGTVKVSIAGRQFTCRRVQAEAHGQDPV